MDEKNKMIEKIFPRIIERHVESRDLMTAKIAKGRGYTREDAFECIRCGSPVKLRSVMEKSQKVHFQGECHCNREIVEKGKRKGGWKKQGSEPEEGQIKVEKGREEEFIFTVLDSKSFKDEGYDIITDGINEIAIIQEWCRLNPELLGVKLVNIAKPEGFKFVWSTREKRRIEDLEKEYSQYKELIESYKKQLNEKEKENKSLSKEMDYVIKEFSKLKKGSQKESNQLKSIRDKNHELKISYGLKEIEIKELKEHIVQQKSKINAVNEYEKKLQGAEEEIVRLKETLSKKITEGDLKVIFQDEIYKVTSKHIKEKEKLEAKIRRLERDLKSSENDNEALQSEIKKLKRSNVY